MMMLTTLLAFAVALGILVTFHELGHYAVARLTGVRVLRFSFGLGPVLWSWRSSPRGTEWTLSAIPLGGYVKMLDEDEAPVPEHERSASFNCKPVGVRMAIVAAGPLANLLLALLVYWGVLLHGVQMVRPLLDEPPAGSAAARAGLHAHDEIVRLAGEPVRGWDDLNWILLRHAGDTEPVRVRLADGSSEMLPVSGLKLDDAQHALTSQLGLKVFEPSIAPVIGTLIADGVAVRGGLRTGDRIRKVDGIAVTDWQQLVELVRARPGRPVEFAIDRQGRLLTVTLTPAAEREADRAVGKIGAGPEIDPELAAQLLTTVRYPLLPALQGALVRTWQGIVLNLDMLRDLVLGRASWHDLSGPLTIADYAGQSARLGGVAYANFLALISIGLGVLNLLPIPLLDGGHLMYHIAEFLRGEPVPQRVVELGQRLGLAALLTLMFFAFYNDITRLLGS
ncbi:MAG: RIP metalloprotease RseP [Betaproteobacteria bacterium]|nr:RIP metalloprotease RseP [Betaproteobacteria bacterium]